MNNEIIYDIFILIFDVVFFIKIQASFVAPNSVILGLVYLDDKFLLFFINRILIKFNLLLIITLVHLYGMERRCAVIKV